MSLMFTLNSMVVHKISERYLELSRNEQIAVILSLFGVGEILRRSGPYQGELVQHLDQVIHGEGARSRFQKRFFLRVWSWDL
jgi:hypothetical protein